MIAITAFGTAHHKDDGQHWLSVSDLMAGLMMIFLFIAISFMRHAQVERDMIKDIVVIANNTQDAIYSALVDEFEGDLDKWNAEIDRESLTIRFKEPDVLFALNSAKIKPVFKDILFDFYPRYIARLNDFSDSLEEIRIEGHTSSEWNHGTSVQEAYFLNMNLSQKRTRSVLEYCDSLETIEGYDWLKSKIAAVGLSSSRPIVTEEGAEDDDKSRRVEFAVKTNFEKRIIQTIAPSGGQV